MDRIIGPIEVQMTTYSRGKRDLASVVVVILVCVGCRPTTSQVSGVVTIDGKSLTLGSDTRGTVVFQPAGGQGTTATGLLDAKGHFDLATGGMSQIRPGNYQVAVSIVRLLPATEGSEQGGQRVTAARYASTIDSGLQANVVPGENKFTFDLTSADEATEEPSSAADAPSGDVAQGGAAEPESMPESPESQDR